MEVIVRQAKRKSKMRRNTRGAVLAEFVIAIVPVLTAFFSFVQLSKLATGRLVVKHGAIIGARAAAVMTNAHENNPGQEAGLHEDEVKQGVQMAMLPWLLNGAMSGVSVKVEDTSDEEDPYNWVNVEVTTTYNCNVPMGGAIVCGLGRTKTLKSAYRMPHQGAIYKVE
jgi:hypothetical protein